MEFRKVTEKTFVCTIGAAEVPLWQSAPNEFIMVDTGTVDSPEFLEFLDSNRYAIKAILQTHLHIDHIANNDALVSRYGCGVYACIEELPDAEFCGRSFTYPVITNERDADIIIDGEVFHTVFTPGHTTGHQMIIFPDGTCCLGDVLMTIGRLKTAKVPYMRNITDSLLSMERVRNTDYPRYLAAHKGVIPYDQLSATVDANIDIELRLYDLLRSLVKEPIPQEELEKAFMKAAGLTSPRVMAFRFMHISCDARIQELVHAGELKKEGNLILPVQKEDYR